MLAFLVRRLIGMVLVLAAVSFIVYFVFVIIPGGDPGTRIAGKLATQTNIDEIRQRLGLDKPFVVQWLDMVTALFTGELHSYCTQLNVRKQIIERLPRTSSLPIAAAIICFFF